MATSDTLPRAEMSADMTEDGRMALRTLNEKGREYEVDLWPREIAKIVALAGSQVTANPEDVRLIDEALGPLSGNSTPNEKLIRVRLYAAAQVIRLAGGSISFTRT
jgi:hypothetical protein